MSTPARNRRSSFLALSCALSVVCSSYAWGGQRELPACDYPWDQALSHAQVEWHKEQIEGQVYLVLVSEYYRRGLGTSHWYAIDHQCHELWHWQANSATSSPHHHKIVEIGSTVYWAYELLFDANPVYPIYNRYHPQLELVEVGRVETLATWDDFNSPYWFSMPHDGQWKRLEYDEYTHQLKAEVVVYRSKKTPIERHAKQNLKVRGEELVRREWFGQVNE